MTHWNTGIIVSLRLAPDPLPYLFWRPDVFRPKAGVPYSIDKLPKYVVYDLNPDVRRRSDRCQITKLEEDEVLNLYYERIYWLLDEYSLAELYQARSTILDEVIANWRLTHPVGEFWCVCSLSRTWFSQEIYLDHHWHDCLLAISRQVTQDERNGIIDVKLKVNLYIDKYRAHHVTVLPEDDDESESLLRWWW